MNRQHRTPLGRTYALPVSSGSVFSTSGLTYAVNDSKGRFVAHAPLSSRKDARDAVVAARQAFPGWSSSSAESRGLSLLGIAEQLESRCTQFVASVRQAEGVDDREARDQVDAAVDRLVWYAGWADKLAAVVGHPNPVKGPYASTTAPHPVGVVAALAPQRSTLLGLVSIVAPLVVTGNTTVVLTSHERPLPALDLAQVIATSPTPAGVVTMLSGDWRPVAPWLAGHMDVDGIDLTGAAGSTEAALHLEVEAAENLKHVRPAPAHEPDWSKELDLESMTAFLHRKTRWQTVGS